MAPLRRSPPASAATAAAVGAAVAGAAAVQFHFPNFNQAQHMPNIPRIPGMQGMPGIAGMPVVSNHLPGFDLSHLPSAQDAIDGIKNLEHMPRVSQAGDMDDVTNGSDPDEGEDEDYAGLRGLPSLGPIHIPAVARPGIELAEELSGCCKAMTAECLACTAGMGVLEFCQERPTFPGCNTRVHAIDPDVAVHSGRGQSDACDWKQIIIGEEVITQRGKGRTVCFSKVHQTIIGVCGEPHTGHDNYMSCVGIHSAPPLCPPRSLWFMQCNEVHPVNVPPLPPADPSVCGCSWSAQHGCTVSAQQLIEGIVRLPESVCGVDTASEECSIRMEVANKAEQFRKCIGLDPMSCHRERLCQWSAQAAGECGVDEHVLVAECVGQRDRERPIVKIVMKHRECVQLTEDNCAANPMCEWTPSAPRAMCDVNPAELVRLMLENPNVVSNLQRAVLEARCRAMHEVKHGYIQTCPSPCHVTGSNVCSLNENSWDRETLTVTSGVMADVLCKTASLASNWSSCPRSCRRRPPRGDCVAPDGLRSFDEAETDIRIRKILTMLMASNFVYADRCHAPERSDPLSCQAATPICDREEHLFAGAGGSSASVPWQHSNASVMGPGFKGVLQKATQAIAAGKADQFIGEYFENNPEAVERLTEKAWDKFATWLDKAKAPEEPAEPVSTLPPPYTDPFEEPPMPVPMPPVPIDYEDEVPPSRYPDFSEFLVSKAMAPWTTAAGFALMAALCVGIASGIAWHARASRQAAREPLLGGGVMPGTDMGMMGMGGMPTWREQEMETAMMTPMQQPYTMPPMAMVHQQQYLHQ